MDARIEQSNTTTHSQSVQQPAACQLSYKERWWGMEFTPGRSPMVPVRHRKRWWTSWSTGLSRPRRTPTVPTASSGSGRLFWPMMTRCSQVGWMPLSSSASIFHFSDFVVIQMTSKALNLLSKWRRLWPFLYMASVLCDQFIVEVNTNKLDWPHNTDSLTGNLCYVASPVYWLGLPIYRESL